MKQTLTTRISSILFAVALLASLQLTFATYAYAETTEGAESADAAAKVATVGQDASAETISSDTTSQDANEAADLESDLAASNPDADSSETEDSASNIEAVETDILVDETNTTEPEGNDAAGSELANTEPTGATITAESASAENVEESANANLSNGAKSTPAEADAADTSNANEPNTVANTTQVAPTVASAKKKLAAPASRALTTSSAPTEIYINPSSGNDTNSGTAEAPIKTLAQVLELLAANPSIKTVYVTNTITAEGELSLPEGVILKRAPGFTGTLINVASGKKLTLSNITIDGDETQNVSGGLIGVSGTLTTNSNVVLQNNKRNSSNYGGAVYVGRNAVFNMNEGTTVSGNTAKLGGGIYNNGTFNMNGGTIDSNKASQDGGGVFVAGSGTMIMKSGTISNNRANSHYGGGISVGGLTDFYGNPKLYIYDGDIISNSSERAGGGIYVQAGSYAYVKAARILNNRAFSSNVNYWFWYAGGGIYVNGGYESYNGVKDGILELGKVYVVNNRSFEEGGGIANCPTSTLEIFLSNGAVVANNYQVGYFRWSHIDDDFYIKAGSAGWNGTYDHSGNPTMYLSSIMLGGGKNDWTYRKSDQKFAPLDETYRLDDDEEINLVNYVSDEDLARAYEKATVIIMGNYAVWGKGGGIGSNGIVRIGVEYPDYGSLSVTKQVEGNEEAQAKEYKFRITLDYKLTGTYGDMEFVDGVAVVTVKNGETKTATGLIPDIEYTVEELDSEGFETTYTIGEEETNAGVIEGGMEFNVVIHNAQLITIEGTKTWAEGSTDLPESITVRLYADGVEVASKQVTAEDGWVFNFTDLRYSKDGQPIVYTISEDEVAGYTTVIDGFNIVNTPVPPEEPEEPEKPEEPEIYEPETPMGPPPTEEPEKPSTPEEPTPETPEKPKTSVVEKKVPVRAPSVMAETADVFGTQALAGLVVLVLLSAAGVACARRKLREE